MLSDKVNLVSFIDSAVHAALSEPPRGHLGASQIGNECERALWYSFRWASYKQFSGRMLILFNRGHEEEARFIRWLTMAGMTVTSVDNKGNQFSFSEDSTGGHFGGSIDGFGYGIPGDESTQFLLEFKTSGAKAFKQLEKSGIEKSKPYHYFQVQIYMHWAGLKRALYMVVNKDDDRLYTEIVNYDEKVAERLIAKAQRIVKSQNTPAGISEKPDWYKCKLCDFHALCHGRGKESTDCAGALLGIQSLPDVNCRTCLHSTPELTPDADGKARWSCAKWECDIPIKGQREGCIEHRYIPSLIPWAAQIDADEDGNIIYEMKGDSHQPFINGSSSQDKQVPFYASKELQAINPLLIGDSNIQKLREQFNAECVPVEAMQLVDIMDEDVPW